MSSFNEAVEMKRFQGGVGNASTTAEVLDGAVNNDQKAGKGVYVRNLDSSIAIFVGRVGLTPTNGYQLPAGEEVYLRVEDPWNIYVRAASGTPAYTWCAH